jgi:DNA repair protein RecO (recombination protein O)
MDERATGIILRTRPLTETSLIVHWLTPALGRIATVAKGALRAKSPFRGKLDLFYRLDFSFQRSRRSELHNLREVNLLDSLPGLRQDLAYLQQASYGAQLIEQTTETETPLPGIFELLDGWLRALPASPPQPLSVFALEVKLLHELGLQPDPAEAKLSAGSRQILERAATADWSSLVRLRLSGAQNIELDRFLQAYLQYHCERVPAGRSAALSGV